MYLKVRDAQGLFQGVLLKLGPGICKGNFWGLLADFSFSHTYTAGLPIHFYTEYLQGER